MGLMVFIDSMMLVREICKKECYQSFALRKYCLSATFLLVVVYVVHQLVIMGMLS